MIKLATDGGETVKESPGEMSQQFVEAFANKHDFRLEETCDDCSTLVKHKAIRFEKTKEHLIMHYAECPARKQGSAAFQHISPKERRKWADLFWGLRGHMEGYDTDCISPDIIEIHEDRVMYFGEDDPYAVVCRGHVSFVSLLKIANEGWEEDDHGGPYLEYNTHYLYGIIADKDCQLNVAPESKGAEPITIAYWDDPRKSQRKAK